MSKRHSGRASNGKVERMNLDRIKPEDITASGGTPDEE